MNEILFGGQRHPVVHVSQSYLDWQSGKTCAEIMLAGEAHALTQAGRDRGVVAMTVDEYRHYVSPGFAIEKRREASWRRAKMWLRMRQARSNAA